MKTQGPICSERLALLIVAILLIYASGQEGSGPLSEACCSFNTLCHDSPDCHRAGAMRSLGATGSGRIGLQGQILNVLLSPQDSGQQASMRRLQGGAMHSTEVSPEGRLKVQYSQICGCNSGVIAIAPEPLQFYTTVTESRFWPRVSAQAFGPLCGTVNNKTSKSA